MVEKAIVLPKRLLERARERAKARGFSGVAAYIVELVQLDTDGALFAVSSFKPARAAGKPRRRESVSAIRKRLLDGMFSYMKASEDPGYGYSCGYTLKHIDRCAAITRDFLASIGEVRKGDSAKILGEVKRAVLRLNRLNASCNGALIATDQREDLCALIQTAANRAGLRSEEDVTAPWRAW